MVPELNEDFLSDIFRVGCRAQAVARQCDNALPVLLESLLEFSLHEELDVPSNN